MPSLTRIALVAILALVAFPALAADGSRQGGSSQPTAERQERCEHGVQKSLCARCNPKLAAVYKAKGDWCPEHARPESQCVPCHPELARKGVK